MIPITSSSIYSPLKIVHHQDMLARMRDGIPSPPLFVQLIPTNRCPARCSFCAYRTTGYSSSQSFDETDEIAWPKLKEMVGDFSSIGVKACELTGGGEPTVHPCFSDLCNALVDAGIDVGIVTNGMGCSKHLDAIRRAKWIRFSIDAGCAATYATTRHVPYDTYERVRDVIRELRSSRDGQDPVIGVGFVVHNGNWSEIMNAAVNAKSDGADNFRISAVFQDRGVDYFRMFYADAKELCRDARQLQDNTFRVFDLFGDRIDDLAVGRPTFPECHFQKLCTYIAADLNVYRCCVVANNPVGLLGSIENRPFSSMWCSDSVQEKLTSFSPSACPHCMTTAKNATIDYCLKNNPPHVNFI